MTLRNMNVYAIPNLIVDREHRESWYFQNIFIGECLKHSEVLLPRVMRNTHGKQLYALNVHIIFERFPKSDDTSINSLWRHGMKIFCITSQKGPVMRYCGIFFVISLVQLCINCRVSGDLRCRGAHVTLSLCILALIYVWFSKDDNQIYTSEKSFLHQDRPWMAWRTFTLIKCWHTTQILPGVHDQGRFHFFCATLSPTCASFHSTFFLLNLRL